MADLVAQCSYSPVLRNSEPFSPNKVNKNVWVKEGNTDLMKSKIHGSYSNIRTTKWVCSVHTWSTHNSYWTCKIWFIPPNVTVTFCISSVYHTAIRYCHSAFCTDVIFPLVRPVTFYLQRISKNDKLMLCNAGGVESILQSIDCMCFISCLTYCTLLCMWTYYKIAIFIIIAIFVTKSSYMYCLGLIDLLFHQSAGWLASAWTGPLWIFRVFLL